LHKGIHKTDILVIFFDNKCAHTMVNERFGSSGCVAITPVIRDRVYLIIIMLAWVNVIERYRTI